jgi:hypothetical protein
MILESRLKKAVSLRLTHETRSLDNSIIELISCIW